MRIIPKTAKVKIEFFKNISIADTIIALIAMIFEALLLFTNLGFARFILMIVLLCLTIGLYLPLDGQRFYMIFVNFTKYLLSVKKYSVSDKDVNSNISSFIPYKNVKDGFIEYTGYFAGVLQIDPREFRLLSEFRQDQIVDSCFGKVIRSISGNTRASLVKIDRKLTLDSYINEEERKKESLQKICESGAMSQEELFAREQIIDDRIEVYKKLNTTNKILRPYYYFVVYDADKNNINEILQSATNSFMNAGMTSKILNNKELCIFLKYNYTNDFEESDADVLSNDELFNWAIPQNIQFTAKDATIDGMQTFNYTVKGYPVYVLNAWGYKIFNIEGTKIVMNLEPYEKTKAVRMIDRSLQELISQSEESYKASSVIDKSTHIDTLVKLLQMLQNDNETLFKVTIQVTVYNKNETRRSLKKKIRSIFSESGFDLVDNYCKQRQAVISSNLSMYNATPEYVRAIHSSSIAAVFPFVLSSIMDDKGIVIGQSKGLPVVVDFFKRDSERVNSNMVIIGKSGLWKILCY
jgi:conjugal transfer ATP-binding protein TraC